MTDTQSPSRFAVLHGREAVGRVYALYDHTLKREVLGTVVACWPDQGPTWLVRLHVLRDDGHLATVHLRERPQGEPGRWAVTRDVPMEKPGRYAALVAARRAYDSTRALGLANPAHIADGKYDATDEVGPWTRWAGDLEADLMVVGQDWSDRRYFEENAGLDSSGNPTSRALADLTASVGRPLPPIPSVSELPAPGANRRTRVFLTNALLWLKEGGMSAAVRPEWFTGDSATFLLEQIAIVQPRVIVALGWQAHRAILQAYGLPVPKGAFRKVVEAPEGIALPGLPSPTVLMGVYHCGARIRNGLRPLAQQHEDWRRVARLLRSEA